LIVACLLAGSPRRLLLPIRAASDPAMCLARIRAALIERGLPDDEADERLRLVSIVLLPELGRIHELGPVLRTHHADELIHAAGCLDYWDKRTLQAVNVDLTRSLIGVASSVGLERIIYVSTAYCSGYRADLIPEQLHPDPALADEPTEYTRTKRVAESIVAASGLAFAIVRPSIVVGDSKSGRYAGKNYGLYQMWRAIEGLLSREYAPIWYTVAPHARLNFVHQDAFQDAFLALHRATWGQRITHIVSDHATSPTMRDLCWLWAEVYRPTEIHCYAAVDDVPLRSIPNRQRRFLELAAKNLEISSRPWRFETAFLDRLRSEGLVFADATLESIARCQRQYIAGSTRIQAYIQQLAARPTVRPRLIELERTAPVS
jgi:nucleoside-diphosphate-sugar epimerase